MLLIFIVLYLKKLSYYKHIIKKIVEVAVQNNNKREIILDAMQELMSNSNVQLISVEEIAKKAGIGKGSIYYYFSSKNEIIEAVIERSYSRVLDKGRLLAETSEISAFEKLEIIYTACLESSYELRYQEEIGSFNELQQSAFMHQQYCRVIITKLEPILSDIIKQGITEGVITCDYPEEMAHIVLLVLTTILDNHLTPKKPEHINRLLGVFAQMQEKSMNIKHNTLDFLTDSRISHNLT